MAGLSVSLDSCPNNVWVLALSGRPLPTDGEVLDKHIDEAVRVQPRMLVVDCTALEFIGSYGIGALLRLQKGLEENHAAMRLAGASPMISRIFQAARLDQRIPMFATLDAALK